MQAKSVLLCKTILIATYCWSHVLAIAQPDYHDHFQVFGDKF